LGVDHLDWHPSLEDYWQSKLKFCDLAKYSIKPGEFEILKNVPDYFLENFPGEHNLYDLSLAYRILEIYAQDKNLKIPEDLLEKAVKNFPHQKFVLQFEGEINVDGKKVKVYNDSKSTHYLSLKASLNSFSKPVILICGGLTKGFDFEEIKDVLKEKVKFGIIIGKDKEVLKKSFPQDKVFLAESLELAFNKALEIAQNQDIILFSPGCASLDMFKSAVHRGEVFSEIVRNAQK
jgi:UDP-N-acetylmuramoylalanine--D-glutamate ligase